MSLGEKEKNVCVLSGATSFQALADVSVISRELKLLRRGRSLAPPCVKNVEKG